MTNPWGEAASPFEAAGGAEGLQALAWAFYDVVESTAPVLESMLPPDRQLSRQKFYEFLSGWTGGPPLFWERRGHPALRLRHAPFPIDDAAASEWVRCLDEACAMVGLDSPVHRFLVAELGRAARGLRNQPSADAGSDTP